MISYKRLWNIIQDKGISQYRLNKEGIGHSTLTRLKRDQYVSLETIDKLCNILDCEISDVVEHIKE